VISNKIIESLNKYIGTESSNLDEFFISLANLKKREGCIFEKFMAALKIELEGLVETLVENADDD
jgi:hypothetical protein